MFSRSILALSLSALVFGACKKDEPVAEVPAPVPGDLMVGHAQLRMPVPLGIGTVGFGGFGVDADPSPFAEIYPATTRIHNHPDFRAMAISRGDAFEVVFLRADTVGIFQQFRRGVVLELQERTGRDFDDVLVIGGTHTHSGPGRVIDMSGPFELIADRFFPEFYEGMVDAMADTVELALADLKPGRVGYVLADAEAGVNDRRCEDGLDYVNGTLPLVAIEQEGTLTALMMAYPIHGTVLNIDELTLSQDVSGGIEQAVEERFDYPVQVMMFNAWGADMAPANPDVDQDDLALGHGGYDQMERVGSVVADAVEIGLADITWNDATDIHVETHRAPINRDLMGYEDGVFEYEFGAVYCGSGYEADCEIGTFGDDLDETCIPFNEEFSAPTQTEITAGRIGDLYLVTWPGESGTILAEKVMTEIRSFGEVNDVMYLGYSQDYLGYSITEDDWWEGGYEASGALWGPKQGDYLAERVVEAFGRTFGYVSGGQEPTPVEAFGATQYDPFVAATPTALGDVLVDVPTDVLAYDVVTFTVAGADPWWGAPIAYLEQADGTPILRPNGLPVTSDGQAFTVELTTDPSYADNLTAGARTFQWHFTLPTRHAVVEAGPDLPEGSYRIRVEAPDGASGVEIVSGAFNLTESAPTNP